MYGVCVISLFKLVNYCLVHRVPAVINKISSSLTFANNTFVNNKFDVLIVKIQIKKCQT